MGMITGHYFNINTFRHICCGTVSKHDLFENVPTLTQKDTEKWTPAQYNFKVEIEGEWYLVSFYSNGDDNEDIMIAVTIFVDENENTNRDNERIQKKLDEKQKQISYLNNVKVKCLNPKGKDIIDSLNIDDLKDDITELMLNPKKYGQTTKVIHICRKMLDNGTTKISDLHKYHMYRFLKIKSISYKTISRLNYLLVRMGHEEIIKFSNII